MSLIPNMAPTPIKNPTTSNRLLLQLSKKRCFQMSEAMYTKFPATNTMIQFLAESGRELVDSPIIAPTTASMLMVPLEQMVCQPVNLLFNKIATSPNSLGISWMKIATTTGTYTVESPVEKAKPIVSPSMVLWMVDPIKLRYPDVPFPLKLSRHPTSFSCFQEFKTALLRFWSVRRDSFMLLSTVSLMMLRSGSTWRQYLISQCPPWLWLWL